MRAEIAAVPSGLGYLALRPAQQVALARLVDRYLGRVDDPPPVVMEDLTFAWAGSTARGHGHYYAIRSDTVLIEYDNTQSNANHVHTVWRDWATICSPGITPSPPAGLAAAALTARQPEAALPRPGAAHRAGPAPGPRARC